MKSMRLLSLLGLLALSAPAHAAEPWEQAIATSFGKAGTEMPGGVYRIALPRSDLKVTLDGVALKPALALGSWLAFMSHGNGEVMVMGDLVLTDTEVNPVMAKLVANGFEITALHNHLLRNSPHTMYMHIGASGDPAKLGKILHDALALSKTPLTAPATSAPAQPDAIDLDTASLDKIMGYKGKTGAASMPMAFRVPKHRATAAWRSHPPWDRPSRSTSSPQAMARLPSPGILCWQLQRLTRSYARCVRTASR